MYYLVSPGMTIATLSPPNIPSETMFERILNDRQESSILHQPSNYEQYAAEN